MYSAAHPDYTFENVIEKKISTIDRITEGLDELRKQRTPADDKYIVFTRAKKNYINHIR